MTSFCTVIAVLYVPTSEIKLYADLYGTLDEALARPCLFLHHLRNNVGERLQCGPWTQLNQQDDDGVEQLFECYFGYGHMNEVHGMVLVTALQDDAELEFGTE